MNTDSFRFTSEVMLINSDGQNWGRTKVQEAKRVASDLGLDLVEVGKNDGISICRVMDYGKWKYEQSKKKKQQKTRNAKEVKFGMRIDKHDQETKIGHINRFLEKGHPVRMVIEMRGRERSYPNHAIDKLNVLISELNGCFKDADSIKRTNGSVSALLHPNKDNTWNGRQNKDERRSKEEANPPQKS